ncbi:hypothetical protein LVD17_26245 [Fulvivirga ulvae]|uniref:hypothetical protein n=1 Tax=Fulvivirga ulvae TaxID=2904245 RepID=UPI001F33A7C6|nr:hypothetical protein [Fulvivirga ulvae]UII31794.1 hypothetical protein LVD17_26245 [Fulvivirga ulvae]
MHFTLYLHQDNDMKASGYLFVRITVLLFLVFALFVPEVLLESNYEYAYAWAFRIMLAGVIVGVGLLLVDWNVRRQK